MRTSGVKTQSIINGVARTLDLGAVYGFPDVYYLNVYNYNYLVGSVDLLALRNDWVHVGNDIKLALNEYGEKTREAKQEKKFKSTHQL